MAEKTENHISHEALFWRMAAQDDEEALKILFFDFYPSLCVFAERYVFGREVARDIVQDSFFKIWENRKKILITTFCRKLRKP